MEQKEIENQRIELGTDLEEFSHSKAGNFLLNLWEQKISITCYDALLGKSRKAENKGEFNSQKLEDFTLNRGFALGVQWVIEDFHSRINTAKRILEERRMQEETEGDSKT